LKFLAVDRWPERPAGFLRTPT